MQYTYKTIVASLCLLLLVGCSESETVTDTFIPETPVSSDILVGEWYNADIMGGTTLTINEDQTGYIDVNGLYQMPITQFEIVENIIVLSYTSQMVGQQRLKLFQSEIIEEQLVIGEMTYLGVQYDNVAFEPVTPPDNDIDTGVWGKSYVGSDQDLMFYPDEYANYWCYGFYRGDDQEIGIRISGTMPKTRYFTFTLYNEETQNNLPDAYISDYEMVLPDGVQNPYTTEGVDNENIEYTINFVPSSTSAAIKDGLMNVREFESDCDTLSIILRHYISEINDFGGVELPEITLFDVTTGETVPTSDPFNTALHRGDLNGMMDPNVFTYRTPNILFYRAPATQGGYTNSVTDYLYSVTTLQEDSMISFQFVPPTIPTTVGENSTADVRYWSVAVGDKESYVRGSLADFQFEYEPGDTITVLIVDNSGDGNNGPSVAERYQEISVAYKSFYVIPWDRKTYGGEMMLFYRNTLYNEDYTHKLSNIEPYSAGMGIDLTNPINLFKYTSLGLGAYGPVGAQIDEMTILEQMAQ